MGLDNKCTEESTTAGHSGFYSKGHAGAAKTAEAEALDATSRP